MDLRNRIVGFGIGIMLVVSLSGCSAMLIGTAAGAVGTYVWTRGNLEVTTQHSAEDLYFAARTALDDLDILVERDRHDHFGANISGRTSAGRKVLIKIRGRTEYTARIRIRVGVIGDRSESQMIMNAVLGEAA